MTIINVQVGASADDADQTTAGTVSLTGAPLLNVDDTNEWNIYVFRGISIPAGATIDAAYLELYFPTSSLDEPFVRFQGEDAAAPATPTASSNNISGRTLTTAYVDWDNAGLGTAAAWYNTPSMVSIVQELVDSYAPYSNGVMAFIVHQPSTSATRDYQVQSYDGDTTLAAKLHIEYTEAGANLPPTVALNTADGVELASTPTLEFTGTDVDADDIRYEIQIGDSPNFVSGSALADNDPGPGAFALHENGINVLSWEGVYHNDDRFGVSFTGNGGVLDKVSLRINSDSSDQTTAGYALVRIYAHQGVYGTSSEPLNAAEPEDTPTPGWLAVSTTYRLVYADVSAGIWQDFAFTGSNRIRLEAGTHYVLTLDWQPDTGTYNNLLGTANNGTSTHDGNSYCDGPSANNGIRTDLYMVFKIYESTMLLDKVSGTDTGFINTVNGADTDPFTSSQKVSYTVQSADELDPTGTYYWRVRAIDPGGSNGYGDWSTARSFTVQPDGSMAGHSFGDADVSGTLTGTGELAGSGAGAASASGTLTNAGSIGDLVGAASGAGMASGTLTGLGALGGGTAGQAACSGDLTGTGAAAGFSAGAGAATGVLVGSGSLAGTTAGVATASGTLVQPGGDGAMIGASAGTSSASGALVGSGSLVGTSSGAAAATASLVMFGYISGAAAGVSIADGTLAGAGALIGLAGGVSIADGAMTGAGLLEGLSSGISTTAGTLMGWVPFVTPDERAFTPVARSRAFTPAAASRTFTPRAVDRTDE